MSSIVIVTPFFAPNIGGAETFATDLVNLYLKNQDQITVITYQPLLTRKISAPFIEKHQNLRVIRMPWLRGNFFYFFERFPLIQIFYLGLGLLLALLFEFSLHPLKKRKIIAIGLSALCVSWLVKLIFWRSELNCVLVTIYRFMPASTVGRVVSYFAKSVKTFYCLSSEAKTDLLCLNNIQSAINFNLWVDQADMFYPRNMAEAQNRIGIGSSNKLALFVGRFSIEKGIKELAALINKVEDGWEFIVIGDGPMTSWFEGETARSRAKVNRIRSVENSELPFYYSAADLLIFAPADKDYLGRASIEAISCGIPLLIYNESKYFGVSESLNMQSDSMRGIYIVDPPLNNVVAFMKKFEEGQLVDLQDKSTIAEQAKLFFSEKNGRYFLYV